MSGPRRPPASRAGTATLQPRAGTGSTRSSGRGSEGPGRKKRDAAKTAAKSNQPKGKARPAGGRNDVGTKAGDKAKAGGKAKANGKANQRAIARVDGPRGTRDGTGEEARRRKVRRRARIMAGLAVTVVLLGVLVLAVLPTSTFLDQRSDARRLEAELAELEAERAAIAAEIDRLGTDSEVEAQARRNGYVQPGEEAYNVLPTPIDPIGLPEVWPFTGVEEAMGVR